MASTYSALQDEVLAFVNDAEAEAHVTTFIALAEADMGRDIRHWKMEKRSTASLSTQYFGLPEDWLETIRLSIQGKRELELISTAKMTYWRGVRQNATGEPAYYTHTAGQIELFPTPDGTYTGELVYHAQIPALSDSTTSNWLLLAAPDAYLYGSLYHASVFLADPRGEAWTAAYARAIERVNAEGRRASLSGSGLARR